MKTRTPVESYVIGDDIIDNQPGSPTYGDTLFYDIQEDIDFYSQEDLYAATLAASGTTDGYEASPTKRSTYFQGTYGTENTTISAGVQFDIWDIGKRYKILKDGGTYVWEEYDKEDQTKFFISPGIRFQQYFPTNTELLFSIHSQSKMQHLDQVYTSISPEDAIFGIINEPNLEPLNTNTITLGLSQYYKDYLLNVTGYHKAVDNYSSFTKVYMQGDETISWYEYINNDKLKSNGLNVSLRANVSDYFTGSASYSISWAENDGSTYIAQDENQNLVELPLDWNKGQSLTLNYIFKIPTNDESFPLFLTDFSVGFLYTKSTGRLYTPNNEDGHSLDSNSASQPDISNAKLKIQKGFQAYNYGKVNLYLEIDNLFDVVNVLQVYPMTGSPYDTGEQLWDDNDPTQYVDPQEEYLYNYSINDPAMIDKGQTLVIGFEYSWY